MKKLLMTFLLGLFCFGIANAQLGIRAGLTSAKVTFDTEGFMLEPAKSKIGFHAGVTYDLSVGTKLMLRPGLLYSTKGWKIEDSGFTSEASLGYIDIPIHLLYKFGADAEKGFFIAGGPTVSLLMSASSDGEDIKDDVNSTDFGFNLGFGYILNPQLSFGLDATVGLSNLDKEASSDDLSIKNQVGTLYVHYKI